MEVGGYILRDQRANAFLERRNRFLRDLLTPRYWVVRTMACIFLSWSGRLRRRVRIHGMDDARGLTRSSPRITVGSRCTTVAGLSMTRTKNGAVWLGATTVPGLSAWSRKNPGCVHLTVAFVTCSPLSGRAQSIFTTNLRESMGRMTCVYRW